MTTKTTTKTAATFEDRLAAAQRTYVEQAERAAAEGAELRQALAGYEGAIQEAKGRADDLRSAFRDGDNTINAADLVAVDAAVEAAELRQAGAEIRLADLVKKSQTNTQTDAAVAVVAAIKAALPGVPVHVTAGPVPVVEESDLPVVVIRQTGGTITSDGTMFSPRGTGLFARPKPGVPVEITFFRGAIHRAVTSEALRDVFRSRNVAVIVHRTTGDDLAGVGSDTTRLTVAQAAPVPVVDSIDEELTRTALAHGIGRALTTDKAGAYGGSRVLSVNTSLRGGLRTVAVTGTSEVRKRPARGGPNVGAMVLTNPKDREAQREAAVIGVFGQHAQLSAVDRITGYTYPSLGRVSRLDVINDGDGSHRWTATLVSRTGWDVPHPDIES